MNLSEKFTVLVSDFF